MAGAVKGVIDDTALMKFMGDLSHKNLTRDISEEEVAQSVDWVLFHVAIPGFARDRIGPCLVIGASRPVDGLPSAEYLVRPVTPWGDEKRLMRNGIVAVPSRILTNFAKTPLNYVTLLRSIIVDFIPDFANVGNSTITLYEYTPRKDENTDDKGRKAAMKLKEMLIDIENGNKDTDLALNIFEYSNADIASSMMLRAEHVRSASVERQLIYPDRISFSIATKHTAECTSISINADLLMPGFIKVTAGRFCGVESSGEWLDRYFRSSPK
ncbi:MAG: hypothetical protein BVN35_17780 [Proteobacteria bacterium ST_bin11]|nr:MAG: hypothetical protein BVN35_17780 [Proteobacteria bacterium ST_bin11]